MYIEELKKNIHPDAYEKFEQNINKQLKATGLDNIFKIGNCYLNSFELFHKETNQKYNIGNTMMFNNYKINLKKASNKIEENNEKATIFVNFPFRFSQIADRWISFEADLVLGEQIYFDNIKIFHKKKLVCSLEGKSFSLYKETSKKIHSKRATKVIFCFQVLEKQFLFTKLDEDTYNVYWFKKDFIGKGREFKYKKQQIKYSKLTNLNNEGIGFIDNDGKHKFFSTCGDIIDVSDFTNNSISNLTSLSMNKFYSITLKNEKNIYFKNKDNTLSPLKNKTNLQEWANLLKNPMQKISDNLFFKIYTGGERGDVKDKSTSLFSKNLIFKKLIPGTDNNTNIFTFAENVAGKLRGLTTAYGFLIQNKEESLTLLDGFFYFLQKGKDYVWFANLNASEDNKYHLDAIKMSLDGIILKKHRLLTFNDLYDDNCFACYKTKKEDICVLVLLPDGNEVQSKTYIFINGELEEIPTPCYFSRVVFFGNSLIACQGNENGFYIFQTHKKIWIPFPQFTLAFISPIGKNLKISKYECKGMGENILFHKPTKLNTEEHESFPENISTTETLFSLNEKKKYGKIYSTKENKYLTLKNKITKCYSPLNFWDCGIFCKEIPHALETINYNLDIISIPMINSKTLANLRGKALPICY